MLFSRNSLASASLAGLSISLLAGCGADSLSLAHFHSPGIKGSGVAMTEARSVGDFAEVDVSAAVGVELTVGSATKLEITADDNLIQHVKTDVVDGKLKISTDTSTSSKIGIKVKGSTPSLKAYHGSGATTSTVTGVKSDRLNLKLSGASQLTISGESKSVSVDCSGASKVVASELKAKSAKVDANGASNVNVHADEELNIDASGASTVRYQYSGDASKLHKEASGASSIAPKS